MANHIGSLYLCNVHRVIDGVFYNIVQILLQLLLYCFPFTLFGFNCDEGVHVCADHRCFSNDLLHILHVQSVDVGQHLLVQWGGRQIVFSVSVLHCLYYICQLRLLGLFLLGGISTFAAASVLRAGSHHGCTHCQSQTKNHQFFHRFFSILILRFDFHSVKYRSFLDLSQYKCPCT